MSQTAANGRLTEEQEVALQTLETFTSTVNLDEVTTEELDVAISFYTTEEIDDGEGSTITRRKRKTRIAKIDTHVPNSIFNKVLKLYDDIGKQYGKEIPRAVSHNLSLEAVLAVWRISEPNMKLEQLDEGLSGVQVLTLFQRFFGSILKLTPRSTA